MNDEFDETAGLELTADEEALLKEMPTLTDVGQARRVFMGQTLAGSLGAFALMLLEKERALAAQVEGREVTTVEGLAKGDQLHPVQAAFIKYDGFQCGYCTPGQICSAVGMLAEARRGDVSHVTEDVSASTTRLTDDEIRERMSGNICRCGAYPGIVAAIREAHSGKETARTWRFVEEEELARVRKEEADETV